MGQHQSGNPQDQGFPDEFGQDLLADQAAGKDEADPKPPSFWGYLTRNWFGPFLLSPPGRREKGHC